MDWDFAGWQYVTGWATVELHGASLGSLVSQWPRGSICIQHGETWQTWYNAWNQFTPNMLPP